MTRVNWATGGFWLRVKISMGWVMVFGNQQVEQFTCWYRTKLWDRGQLLASNQLKIIMSWVNQVWVMPEFYGEGELLMCISSSRSSLVLRMSSGWPNAEPMKEPIWGKINWAETYRHSCRCCFRHLLYHCCSFHYHCQQLLTLFRAFFCSRVWLRL